MTIVYVKCEVCGYKGMTVGFGGVCPCPHDQLEPQVPDGQEALDVDAAMDEA